MTMHFMIVLAGCLSLAFHQGHHPDPLGEALDHPGPTLNFKKEIFEKCLKWRGNSFFNDRPTQPTWTQPDLPELLVLKNVQNVLKRQEENFFF